jgi:hypothetical protein
MGVPILIRVFPQQVIQVVTTITEALLPSITAVITWWITATGIIIITMATTINDPRIVPIMVCRIMATKSQHMAWEEVTKEMTIVVIIKAVAPIITIITTCQDIIKMIGNPCKREDCPAIMAMAWIMGEWEAATHQDKLFWFITKRPVAIKALTSLMAICLAAIIIAPGIMKMVLQSVLIAEEEELAI